MTKGRAAVGILLLAIIGVIAFFLFALGSRVVPLSQVITETAKKVIDPNADIEKQQPLASPPSPIKAVYATSWSASSAKKLEYFFDLIRTTELNAIVIDIKESGGVVAYEPEITAVKEYGAFEKRIPKINALIKRFHDEGIYVIGRIAVFQDEMLVKARPDLALKSIKTGQVWGDRKNIHWLDTGAPAVWDYNIDIARDALSRGFDEINFDYIRFATDGDTEDIVYPFSVGTIDRRATLRQFFSHVRSQLPYARISADIFGEAVVNYQETSIGQFVEDTLEPFDFVAPMIYPSHFNKNFLGLTNSAAQVYPVIRYSMDRAYDRLAAYQTALFVPNSSTTEPVIPALAEFRPWLQDFNLGATYDAAKVRAQITAVDDSARAAAGCPGIPRSSQKNQVVTEPTGPRPVCDYSEAGFMLWSPSNVYTKGALMIE